MKARKQRTVLAAAMAALMLLLSACGGGTVTPAVTPTPAGASETGTVPKGNVDAVAVTPRPKVETLPRIETNPNNGNTTQSSGGGYLGNPEGYIYYTAPVIESDPYYYLPYQSGDNYLAIMSLSSYDGIFLEDGSDAAVSGITTALVVNVGVNPIEYAKISIDRNGTTLVFELTDLPSGEYMVVQEKYATPYEPCSAFKTIITEVAELNYMEFSEYEVAVYENDNGGITVENISDHDIPCVRVFYKFYAPEQGVFVGGITYVAKIDNLACGEARPVVPSHYASGSSQIIMVRTFNS